MNEEQQILLDVLKHDEHKTRGRRHNSDCESVPFGADKFSSFMSRKPSSPTGKRAKRLEQAENNHYRISILTRERLYESKVFDIGVIDRELSSIFSINNPKELHNQWLNNKILTGFNESYYMPYTSLKYHTLITTALVYNRLKNRDYSELYLVLKNNGEVSYDTIFNYGGLHLKITSLNEAAEGDGTSKIPTLDRVPHKEKRNFSKVWSNLTKIKDISKHLDACLRQMNSWSTALQYIEDIKRFGWNKKTFRGELA